MAGTERRFGSHIAIEAAHNHGPRSAAARVSVNQIGSKVTLTVSCSCCPAAPSSLLVQRPLNFCYAFVVQTCAEREAGGYFAAVAADMREVCVPRVAIWTATVASAISFSLSALLFLAAFFSSMAKSNVATPASTSAITFRRDSWKGRTEVSSELNLRTGVRLRFLKPAPFTLVSKSSLTSVMALGERLGDRDLLAKESRVGLLLSAGAGVAHLLLQGLVRCESLLSLTPAGLDQI